MNKVRSILDDAYQLAELGNSVEFALCTDVK